MSLCVSFDMDEESECSSISGIHHPRLDYSRHGFADYSSGLQHPGHPSTQYGDFWSQGQKGHMYSSGSSPSTFEEVESLCLSRSSNDSSLYRQQMRNLPRPGMGNGLGPNQGQFRNGKYLSRQSSGTSTSTSSGNLHEPVDRQSRSASTSGSAYENSHPDTLDPRQQFNFNDPAFLEGMFRRVLEWNQMYAAMAMGRGGAASGLPPRSSSPLRSSPGRFSPVPPGSFPPGGFCQIPPDGLRPRSSSPVPPRSVSPGPGSDGHSGPVAAGRRVPDLIKEKSMSTTSDMPHVRKRRDLILPDEEDEFSFSQPSTLKPEAKSSNSVSTQSGYTPTTPSLKQASSESMLSSMSSMSQSQDLGWREQFNHDWREAQHAIWREQADQGFGDPYVNPWRRTDPSQQIWRDPPMLFHPSAPQSSAMMMPPPCQMPGHRLSRGMSIESMTSLGMVSPPESYVGPYGSSSQNPAEMMLMNLGFGGAAEGFLPERFLRDWYSKISRTHGQYPGNPPRPPDNCSSPYDNTFSPHNKHSPRAPRPSKPNYEDLRSASDLHRRIAQPFNRSVIISASQGSDPPETPTSLLPPNLGKESRTDRLKEYIEAYAQNMSSTTDARSVKIRQFACSRQKSLPSYLETLTEEEEVKSRSSWHKPQDGECRLQAFLREDSLSTASGQSDSQCNSSAGGSNDHSLVGSESDSLSGSDHVDYNQRMRQRWVTSCEQTNCAPYSQPAPIASRVLKLTMPSPSERRARLKSDSRNVDGEEVLSVTENQSQIRPLINITSSNPEKTEQQNLPQTSHSQHAFSQKEDERKTNGLCRSKSPKASRSPKRRHSPGSSNQKPRSSSLLKMKSGISADSIIITEEECSDGMSTDGNFHGNVPTGDIDRNRLFVSQIPMESPVRRCYDSSFTQYSAPTTSGLQIDSSGIQNMLTIPTAHRGFQSKDAQTDQNCDGDRHNCHSDSLLSTESLEVADIFQKSGQTINGHFKERSLPMSEGLAGIGSQGLIEPAMISIVLEDVNGNQTDNVDSCDMSNSHHQEYQQQGEEGIHQDDLLQIPSCSSSISLSPIPLSPVTVIEVNLDNQQDSIDTEESAGSSKDQNDEEDETCDYENETVRRACNSPKNEMDDFEFSRSEERYSDSAFSYPVPLSNDQSAKGRCRESSAMCDACVDADDGSVSPILLLNTVSPGTSSSSSPSVAAMASQLSDVGTQVDDGTLSPLVFLSQDDLLSDLIQNDNAEDLYLVSDQAIQCGGEDLPSSSETNTRNILEPSQEIAVPQMCDTSCQTRHQVMYEMSSQTDSTNVRAAENFHHAESSRDRIRPNHMSVPGHNLLSLKDLSLFYKSSITPVISSKRTDSTLTQPHLNILKSQSSLESSRSQSFDSEFWEYMGMDIPLTLKRSEVSSQPVEKHAQGCVSSSEAKPNSHVCTHVTRSAGHAQSANQENEESAPSDSYEIVRALTSNNSATSQSPSDRLHCHTRQTHGHSSALPTKSFVAVAARKSHNQEAVHTSRKQLQLHSQIHSSSSSSEHAHDLFSIEPATSLESKALNANFAVPKYSGMENGTVSNSTDSSYFSSRTVPLESPKLAVVQTGEQEVKKNHVSHLIFQVGDYRAIANSPRFDLCGSDTNIDFNKQTVSAKVQKTTTECTSKITTLVSDVSQTKHNNHSDAYSKKVEKESPSSRLCDRVDDVCSVRAQNLDASSLNHIKDTDPDVDSGIIDSPTSSCLMSHDEEQSTAEQSQKKDMNAASMRGESIDDFCDKDFKSTEEAREFVLSKFLLRGSAGSQSMKNNSSESAPARPEPQNSKTGTVPHKLSETAVPSSAGKTDYTLRTVAEQDALDRLMYKSLVVNQTPEAVNGLLEHSFEENIMKDSHQSKATAVIEPKKANLEESTFTGQDAIRNLAIDCFLHEPVKVDPKVSTQYGENVLETQKDAHVVTSVRNKEDRCTRMEEGARIDMDKVSSISSETNTDKELKELGDLRDSSSLIDAFVTSVLQSACEEIYKNYLEDKQKLQNRLKVQLKLTGAMVTREESLESFVPPLQERTRVGVDLEAKTSVVSNHSDEQSNDLNAGVMKEQMSLPSLYSALSVTEASESYNRNSQDLQDSVSDASSELSVVYVASQPAATEAVHQTESKEFFSTHTQRDSERTPLNVSQASVFLDTQPSPWHDYGFQAYSPLGDVYNKLKSCLSPARSHSADSLDSLRANCSGSIDDILDAVDVGNETTVLQRKDLDDANSFLVFSQAFEYSNEDFSQGSSSTTLAEDMSSSVQSDSDGPGSLMDSHTASTDQDDAHNELNLQYSGNTSSNGFIVNNDIGLSRNTTVELVGQSCAQSESAESGEVKINKDSWIGSSDIAHAEDLLTDAKLTQLILMGTEHPDFQRLKEQGILMDSYDSSPSFTTPDNEADSDVDDQGLGDPSVTSPAAIKDQQSNSELHSVIESHISQRAYTELMSVSDLPDICEETSVLERYDDKHAETRSYRDDTHTSHDSNYDFKSGNPEHGGEEIPGEMEPVSQKAETGIDVSIQPLPREFHASEFGQRFLNDDEGESDQTCSGHRGEVDSRVFTFDMDYDELNRSLLWPGRSEATDFIPIQRKMLSPLPDEEENLMSPEVCALSSRNVGFSNNSSMNFDDCYYRTVSITTSSESDQFTGEVTDSVSSGEVHYTYPTLGATSVKEFASTDDQSVPADLSEDISTNTMSETNRRQIRSQLFLSLHPMQSESFEKLDAPQPSRVLSAAQRREAYNKVTSDRSGFGISSSFSEENLSSPPLRPRRFQRSLSKESSCSDFSPKRTKRTVSRSSPNFNTGQTCSGNSLQVPNMGESLASKNTSGKRNRSPPGSEHSRLPSCQSPNPDGHIPSRTASPSVSRNNSPTFVGIMPDVLLSPHPNSPSSRAPSPIPDVTISSVNQSLELISFASSPEGSSRGSSPPCDNPLQSPGHSPGRIKTTVFENSHAEGNRDTTNSQSSPGHEGESSFTTNHPERLSPYRYIESSSPKHRSPRLSKFRALQKLGTISSPDGSPVQMTPSIFRSHSSSGDEAGPLQIPVSRTFYSSKHTLLPQPRARLWAMGDRNSSSTESPMPSTPPLSRDHSSTSDSSSSHKDSQSTTSVGVTTSTCVSPKSPAAELAKQSTDPPAETDYCPENVSLNAAVENDSSRPAATSTTACSEETKAPEQPVSEPLTGDTVVHPTPDQVPNCGPPATSSEPDPLKALHLRRSRFQKPENTISLQQFSSSSEQSSFETTNSPCRRYFWASGQKTVVSIETFSKEGSVTEHIPHRVRSTWTSNDLARTSAQSDSKHRVSGNKVPASRDSSSSPSDHMSSDGSPAHSRMSSHNDLASSGSAQTSGTCPVDGGHGCVEKSRVSVKSGRKDSMKKNARQLAQ